MSIMTRCDWTLLALAAAGGQPLSPVQLQKSLFLLGKECAEELGDDFYSFAPHNYGPFDARVYADAEELEIHGLAQRIQPAGRSWSEYAATPSGMDRAGTLRSAAPPRAAKYLEAAVSWAKRQTFEGLVRAIYKRYPETRSRSIFRG